MFMYYECPSLCPLALDGLIKSLKPLSFTVGREFDVLTISVDPSEEPRLAAAKKQEYLPRYGRPGAESGWHFLTGDENSIKSLTQAVGFRYASSPLSHVRFGRLYTTLMTVKHGLVLFTIGLLLSATVLYRRLGPDFSVRRYALGSGRGSRHFVCCDNDSPRPRGRGPRALRNRINDLRLELTNAAVARVCPPT
jgi:hypothetical protein